MGNRRVLCKNVGMPDPDVKLGGMASVITSKADLLTWFNFQPTNTVADISNFWIKGNDVFFITSTNYDFNIKTNFKGNSSLTSIIDYKGKFGSNLTFEVFMNTPNLYEVYAPKAIFGHSTYRNCGASIIHQPMQTTLGGRTFQDTFNLSEINQPNVTSSTYYDCYNSRASIFNFPELLTITSNSGSTWYNCINATLINAPKLKNMGVNAYSNRSNFYNIKLGCEIRVHVDLLTADAGNPHVELIYAKNIRSAIVKFYDNSGNYVSTL